MGHSPLDRWSLGKNLHAHQGLLFHQLLID